MGTKRNQFSFETILDIGDGQRTLAQGHSYIPGLKESPKRNVPADELMILTAETLEEALRELKHDLKKPSFDMSAHGHDVMDCLAQYEGFVENTNWAMKNTLLLRVHDLRTFIASSLANPANPPDPASLDSETDE